MQIGHLIKKKDVIAYDQVNKVKDYFISWECSVEEKVQIYLFVLALIEEGYHSSNPYHNSVHAADVAQAMHCYMIQPKVRYYQ